MATVSPAEGVVSDISATEGSAGDTYNRIRRQYEEYMHVTFDELGLASREQTQQLRQWIESIDPHNEQDLLEARRAYDENYHRMMKTAIELHKNCLDQLHEARRDGVISEKSYREWIGWIRDTGRDYQDKEDSIRYKLPEYLRERRAIAKDRTELIGDDRLKDVTSGDLRTDIGCLTNDTKWFSELEFTQRKNLIDRIKAGLAVENGGEKMKQLKADAQMILIDATKEPQPALHRDKVGTWLKRIFEDGQAKGATYAQLEAFVKGQGQRELGGLIKVWRDIAVKFWTTRMDPAFTGVKTEFKSTKWFLWMHYSDRVEYVNMMRAQRDRAVQLRSRAWSTIQSASPALDARGRRRWLNDYVFNGKHTLPELESIVNGNLAVRLDAKMKVYHRYEKAKIRAKKFQGIRGMDVPEKGSFLHSHYERQMAKVEEMEHRIMELEKNSPDFLLIRHTMDREDWDEALALIGAGKKKECSQEDKRQLASMEQYVMQHSKVKEEKVGKIEKSGDEAKNIDELFMSLPSDLRDIVLVLAEQGGSECVRMFGWGMYNREWCNLRGYLNPEREAVAVEQGKQNALEKLRRKKRKGAVSETIQGETGEEEYIELSRSSATNVCLDIADAGAKSAFVRTVHRTKSDHRAWYWTNVLLHRGGVLMSRDRQKEENQKIYKVAKLLAALNSRGETYGFRGTQSSLVERAKMAGGGKKNQEKSYAIAG